MENLKKFNKRKKKDILYDAYSGLNTYVYPSYENSIRIGPAPTADQQSHNENREDPIFESLENIYGNVEDIRTEPQSPPNTVNLTPASIPPPFSLRNVPPKLSPPHTKLPLPPILHKNVADRHEVLQRMSDITLSDSTFQADVHQAPHVKIEKIVCCSIHVDDTNCDCKTNRNNDKKSKIRRFHKLIRGTSIVIGLYWIYNLHKIFETP